jgi:hypothetical protein
MASLVGERLAFERNGNYLIVADASGISVGDRRIDMANVCAVAGFGEQLWIATTTQVIRTDLDGGRIGRPWSLAHVAADRRAWLPLPVGPRAVGVSRTLVITEAESGNLVAQAHAGDLVIPVTTTQVVSIERSRGTDRTRLTLPTGRAAWLPAGSIVEGAGMLADGNTLVLSIASGSRRLVVAIALGGELIARHDVAPGTVRIATRRGLALVAIDRRVDVVDLRDATLFGTFTLDAEPDDLAIDPDGARVALRTGGRVEVSDVKDRLRSRPRVLATNNLPLGALLPVDEAPTLEKPEPEPPPARTRTPARDLD